MLERSMMLGVLAALAVLTAASAWAQTSQSSPPANPAVPEAPNADTPPGGVARGVVVPPTVDPGMVTPPPQASAPTMPVIKPPVMAK